MDRSAAGHFTIVRGLETVSRQIVNTNSQSRARSEARTFGGIAIVLAIAVVLIFFFMNKAGLTAKDLSGPATDATTSSAPASGGTPMSK